jgi:hypothetical protein
MIARLAGLGLGCYVGTVAVIYGGARWYYSRKWPMYAPAKEERSWTLHRR